MTVGETVALAGFVITAVGFFVRFGIVLPIMSVIQPLEISITTLTDALEDGKEERKDLAAAIQRHDIRLSGQEQESKTINRKLDRIEQKIDTGGPRY